MAPRFEARVGDALLEIGSFGMPVFANRIEERMRAICPAAGGGRFERRDESKEGRVRLRLALHSAAPGWSPCGGLIPPPP